MKIVQKYVYLNNSLHFYHTYTVRISTVCKLSSLSSSAAKQQKCIRCSALNMHVLLWGSSSQKHELPFDEGMCKVNIPLLCFSLPHTYTLPLSCKIQWSTKHCDSPLLLKLTALCHSHPPTPTAISKLDSGKKEAPFCYSLSTCDSRCE